MSVSVASNTTVTYKWYRQFTTVADTRSNTELSSNNYNRAAVGDYIQIPSATTNSYTTTAGDFSCNGHYVCVATNTWKRSALSTW